MFSKMPVKSCECDGCLWPGTGPTAESSQSTLCRETSTSGTTAGCGHRSRAQQKRGSGSHNEASLDSNRAGQILGTLVLSGCQLNRLFSRNVPWILSDETMVICHLLCLMPHDSRSFFIFHRSFAPSMILVAILTSCTITSQVSCVLDQKKSSQIQEGNLQTSRHFRSFIVQYNPQLFTPGFYNPKASIRMPRQKWFQILNRKWRRRTPKRSNARRMRCACQGLSCEMLA